MSTLADLSTLPAEGQARLGALLERHSVPRLQDPAPTEPEQQWILAAGLRAPDHARLRPWRFLSVLAEGRVKLGELLMASARRLEPEAGPERWQRALEAPLRAPWVVVVIVSLQEHPKVPSQEQWSSAACAAYGMLLAADVLGYGGVWRTGPSAYDREFMQQLGLAAHEHIVGFLYLGTPAAEAKVYPLPDLNDHVAPWPPRDSSTITTEC